MIDIFDCSDISFFLDEKPLTPNDPNLLMTIQDTNMHGVNKYENSFIRFSNEYRYFYINESRKSVHIYDLEEDVVEKVIK